MMKARKSLVASLAFFALLLLAGSALLGQAQNVVYYTDNSPINGSRNAFPFGNGDIRYQTIVPNVTFGNRVVNIRDILVAGTNSAMEAIYDDIEIRMGVTQQVLPTNNWNTNNPNPTTVYRGPLRVRFEVGKWGGIGLPKPYLFLPLSSSDNLCVEVIVWSATAHGKRSFYFPLASGTAARAFAAGWVVSQTNTPTTSTSSGCKMGFVLNNGNVAFAGVGCTSAATLQIGGSSWPQPNQQFSLTLTGGKPAALANLVLGVSHAKWGTSSLPLDMAIFGAPNCFIWNDPLIRVPLVTNASGQITITSTVPATATFGTVFAHWWVADASANAFGVASSDYATIILGN